MSDILYLASESLGRQELLRRCGINFETVRHDADELSIDPSLKFDEYVLAIASEKMNHVDMPGSKSLEDKAIFVLTADTLVYTERTKHILGKPEDFEDAKRMLKIISAVPILVTTGCVIEKKIFEGQWKPAAREELLVNTKCEYIIEDSEIEWYLNNTPHALKSCGGATIEGLGFNYLKSVDGSYSTIIGLPMYEVRGILKKMGFKF